jgi:chromosome segregation protein
MRLAHLLLARYGHLTDVELRFPTQGRLDVVLGANEAGKSTALAAIGDALYGFPHRTPFAFLHDQSELRVAFDLVAADGTTHGFARIKRRRDDLTDQQGRPVPESTLIAVRGAQDRKFFEDMFGLNGARLREGGDAILAGRGEVGATIFQASSGLHHATAALAQLKEQADLLYTPRRVASRAFYQAVDAHKAARDDLGTRSLRGEEYEAKREERTRLDTTITLNTERERAYNAERRRLERIRRTLPALDAHARASGALAELGPVPNLPDDAEAQRQDAILRREVAAQALARGIARREEVAAAHDAIALDEGLLREAEAIDALARELRRIDAAIGDRALQEAAAEQHASAIERFARDLGLADIVTSGGADVIVALMPNAVARAALRRAVKDHAALAQRLSLASENDATARREAEAAAHHVAALPPPPDPAALTRALAAARAEGRIDEECDRAHAAIADASGAKSRALASLLLWRADAASLRAAPVPAAPILRRHEESLGAAESAVRDAAAELARLNRELADAADRLIEISAGEKLPTEAAIAAARDRRDMAWRLIRRHHVDGGPSPSEAEAASLPALPLPDALEALTREADRIADRRNAEAKRISEYELALATRDRRQAASDRAATAHSNACATRDACLTAWRGAWAASGVTPLDPAAMRDWLAARKDVLSALAAEEDARRHLHDAAARRDAARAALLAHVPDTQEARLAPLLREAETLAALQTAAANAHAEAVRLDAQARHAAENFARALASATADMAAWQSGWSDLLPTLSLPASTAAEDAEVPLALWEQIATAAQARDTARGRIAEMTGAITAFARQAGELAARIAPDLAAAPPGIAVADLAARLRETRDRAGEKSRHATALAQLDGEIAEARTRHDDASRILGALRHLAGVVTDDELAEAIDRVARRATLAREIAAQEANLRSQGEGLAIATLRVDAADADLDALAARIDEIDGELTSRAETSNAARQRLGQLDAELARMEVGQNAAEAAQQMENNAAEATDIAARYVRIRLAGALLRAGLDRFRRKQQDPLLRRASEHFARLTGGRHLRLEVIEDERDEQAIISIAAHGRRCPVTALSEGTRDQLYLALRLAAIEDYADRAPPLPFIADDLLVQFDDSRARAAIAVLADLAARTQVILFTHHEHVAAMVTSEIGHVQRLPPVSAAQSKPDAREAAA